MQANDWGAVIDKLAAKLSVPAAELWTVLVAQGRIDALVAAAWMATAVAVALWLVTTGRRRAAEIAASNHFDGDMIWVPWWAAMIGSVIALCAFVPTILTGLFNPRFLALKYILDAAK